MKKKKILAIVLATSLALSLGLVTSTNVGATNGSMDSVNIGDTTSEAGHNLLGWSNPWVYPGWGGNYGGYGSGGGDGTFRLLMGPGDGCGTGYEDAYFSMSAGAMCADKLVLHHLDGSQDDNFDVYVLDGAVYTLIGNYASHGGVESWVTTDYTFSPRSGEIQFKLVATGTVTGWCGTWGQVAFSWAELYGGPCPVTIDIKPCSDPNSINLKSKGVVPVAVLTTDDFDATTVDPENVVFAGADPVRWTVEDVCPWDGQDDLLLFFKTQELDLDENSTEATLTGETDGDILIEGADAVNIVPKKNGK